MKSSVRTIATVASINMLVLAVLVGAIELVLGRWFEHQVYCVDYRLHHSYCPGSVRDVSLSPEDGGARVEVVLNRSRVRMPDQSLKDGVTDVSQYDIVNIGDSFIEANRIPYDETLGAIWSRLSGKRVLQFGHGSWAPILYKNWLPDQKLKPGVIVNLFISVIAASTKNASYHEEAIRDKDGWFVFPGQESNYSFKNYIKLRSWFYEKIYSRRSELYYLSMSNKQLVGDFSNPTSDCSRLQALRKWSENFPHYQTITYLVFAFRPECWSETEKRDVEGAIDDINQIVEQVTRAEGKVNVFIVPPGWSFPGENLIGKTTTYYMINEGSVITIEPLAEYMGGRIHARVISLETVIKKLKVQYPGTWYFPKDGHWTPYAYRHLAGWLNENFSSGQ